MGAVDGYGPEGGEGRGEEGIAGSDIPGLAARRSACICTMPLRCRLHATTATMKPGPPFDRLPHPICHRLSALWALGDRLFVILVEVSSDRHVRISEVTAFGCKEEYEETQFAEMRRNHEGDFYEEGEGGEPQSALDIYSPSAVPTASLCHHPPPSPQSPPSMAARCVWCNACLCGLIVRHSERLRTKWRLEAERGSAC